MEITGKIVRVPVSGGSWGIEGDDGQRYMPVSGLPKRFHKSGIRVKVSALPASGVDIFMWGKQISVSSIQEG